MCWVTEITALLEREARLKYLLVKSELNLRFFYFIFSSLYEGYEDLVKCMSQAVQSVLFIKF